MTQPWLGSKKWANGRVQGNTRSNLRTAWLLAGLWNLVSAPMLFVIPRELERNPVAAVGFLFPVVGVGLVAWAVTTTLRWRRFGPSSFKMSPLPASPGARALASLDRQFPTPNSQLPTPNSQLPTPNSQLPKPRAPKPSVAVPDGRIRGHIVLADGTRLKRSCGMARRSPPQSTRVSAHLRAPRRHIVVVAFPDVQMLDVTGPLEVFSRTARWLVEQGHRPIWRTPWNWWQPRRVHCDRHPA